MLVYALGIILLNVALSIIHIEGFSTFTVHRNIYFLSSKGEVYYPFGPYQLKQ